MARSNVLVAIFIVTVAAVAAVVVQRDPFVRLIPADILRGKLLLSPNLFGNVPQKNLLRIVLFDKNSFGILIIVFISN